MPFHKVTIVENLRRMLIMRVNIYNITYTCRLNTVRPSDATRSCLRVELQRAFGDEMRVLAAVAVEAELGAAGLGG